MQTVTYLLFFFLLHFITTCTKNKDKRKEKRWVVGIFPSQQITALILFKLCCMQNHRCISALFMLASADSVTAATSFERFQRGETFVIPNRRLRNLIFSSAN